MRLKFLVFSLILFYALVECKRSGGGRSRGTSGSGSGFWSRRSNKSKYSAPKKPSAPAPEPQPKPVAPPKPAQAAQEPTLKRDNANLQQSASNPANPANTNSRPIGWNVDNNQNKQNVNPSQSGAYPNSGAGGYPNSGGYPQGANSNPGGYPQGANSNPGGFQHGASYPNSGGYPQGANSNPGGYPHGGGYPQGPNSNPGGYPHGGGYPQGANPNAGGYPHGAYPNTGGYPHGAYPNAGGYPQSAYPHGGGYPSYGNAYPGAFGGGGFGGGGFGGGGFGGYPMKKSGGIFGRHAFRNILGGLLIWHVVSGLTKTPYRVYNYYNMPPKEEREEITLPANVLTLCNENATDLCTPGTMAICTTNNTFFCVTTMSATNPCKDNKGELCVKSTIPCLGTDDPLCQNKTSTENTTTINLPCLTNVTVDSVALLGNVTLPPGDSHKYCVTTMAVPDPTIDSNSTMNATDSIVSNNTTIVSDSTIIDNNSTINLNVTDVSISNNTDFQEPLDPMYITKPEQVENKTESTVSDSNR